jgi:hypothetical protein
MEEKLKEDGCRETENKGEKIDDKDEIFYFEGGNKWRRVWMVLQRQTNKVNKNGKQSYVGFFMVNF